MDPPYRKELEKDIFFQLSSSNLLKEDSIIVVEAALDTDFDYLDEYGFEIYKIKSYKTNQHVFIRRK